MAIRATQVVMAQGRYDLDARARAPGLMQDLRKHHFTAHHILPYAYPQFIGLLLEHYRDTLRGGMDDWPEADTGDQIAELTTAFLNKACWFRTRANTRTLNSQLAWMSPNLFWGPSGNYRIDDPGEARETRKPASMAQWHWDKLETLKTEIDRLVTFDGRAATVGGDITAGQLAGLLRLLDVFVQRNHSNALKFDPTDWIVMWSQHRNYQPPANPTDQFRERFAAYERRTRGGQSEITWFKPKLDTPNPRGDGYLDLPVPALWRLREAGERVPDLILQTSMLQPPQGG